MSSRTFLSRFHHQVISDDIDDIQDPIRNMSRWTFFKPVRGFAWAWMAIRARNHSPWGLATLNPLSTCHGPRPGPNLRSGVRAGSLRATEPRALEKNRSRNGTKCRWAKKNIYTWYSGVHSNKVPLRDVCDAKSRGWRKLKRDTR